MISTLQKHTGNGDNGPVVNLPPHLKPGVMEPTPENLERVAANAAAQRARTALQIMPQEFGRQFGIQRYFAQFVQRLEARVIELEREVATLRSTSSLPPH